MRDNNRAEKVEVPVLCTIVFQKHLFVKPVARKTRIGNLPKTGI